MENNKFSEKKKLLDELYYAAGKQASELNLTILTPDGAKSKWRPYLDAQTDDEFINEANNRQILLNETVIDLDLKDGETTEELKSRYEKTIETLDVAGLSYKAYFSGSKGYHIHLIFNELISLEKSVRERMKEYLIRKYGGDLMKKSDRTMIALENAPHWKTGGVKTLLNEKQGNNNLQPTLEEMEKESAKNNTKSGKTKDSIIEASFYEYDGYLYEEVYDGRKVMFAKWDGNKVEYVDNIQLNDGRVVNPIFDDAILEGAVLLPSKAEDYESVEILYFDIVSHIHTYLDISKEYEEIIAPVYILLSWNYDRFSTIPYARALGDTGVGKSRFLDVIGSLCYKPCIVSGSITPAPIYRMIKKWRGSIIIDEADFADTTTRGEVVKILNCGFEKNKPVIRCDLNNPEKVLILPTFGIKIIGSRFPFDDKALESRCLTEKMVETTRQDIPNILPKEYHQQEKKLRNQLLMYRFKTRNSINPELIQTFDFGNIEPRLKQAASSFAVLLTNFPLLKLKLKDFLTKYNEELIEERAATFEGRVVEILFNLKEESASQISSSDICDKFEVDYNIKNVTPQKVGKYLKSLKIQTKQERIGAKVRRVIVWDNNHMSVLKKRYIPVNTTNATNTTLATEQEIVASVASVASVLSEPNGSD